MSTTLGIGVKATADFSDVERGAERTASRIAKQLGGSPTSPASQGMVQGLLGGRGSKPQDVDRALDGVRKAIERTAQAGKRLRDIRFPTGQFADAEKQIRAIERRIALVHMSPWGKDLKKRLYKEGADLGRPLGWDWAKLYGGNAAAGEAARQRFFAGATPQAGGTTPAQASNLARLIAGAMERAIGGSGMRHGADTGEATATGGAPAGGALAGLLKMVPRLAGAAGSIVGGGIALYALKAYAEHLRTLEDTDAIYKSSGYEAGFEGLQGRLRDLGNELQLTASEATRLARTFISTSGAVDTHAATGRAWVAGKFGRGYGMDPGASSGLFARAGLVGYGTDKRSQREFALLLAQTIGASNMFARSEQVMGDLVGQVETIATQQGRTPGSGEIAQLGRMFEVLYQNPAMRGGGANMVMESLQRAGSGGGLSQDMLSWQAFGAAVGYNPAKVIALQQAAPFTSPADLFGKGYSAKTRAELVHEAAKRGAALMPGEDEAERMAYYQHVVSGTTMAGGKAMYRLMEDLRGGGGSFSDFLPWMENQTGRTFDKVDPSSYAALSQLYRIREDHGEAAVRKRRSMAGAYLEGGNVPADLQAKLQAAGKNDAALAAILPRVVAATSAMGTLADQDRTVKAKLTNELAKLGDEVHAVTLKFNELKLSLARGLTSTVDATEKHFNAAAPGIRRGAAAVAASVIPSAGASEIRRAPPRLANAIPSAPQALQDAMADEDPRRYRGVDPRLQAIIEKTRAQFPLKSRITSGLRPGDKGRHGSGRAMDIQLFGADGKPLPNYQSGAAFRAYELFAQQAYLNAKAMYPELADGQGDDFNWGAGFGDDGKGGLKYGSNDLMHFALDANNKFRAHGGKGPLGGLTGKYRGWYDRGDPMGGSRAYSPREHATDMARLGTSRAPAGLTKDELEAQGPKPSGDTDYYRLREQMFKAFPPESFPPTSQALPPRMPWELDKAIAEARKPVEAKWQGQVAMDVTFRDSRGNVVQRRQALAVSEPRIAGSGGSSADAGRLAWSDTVTLPAFA